MYKVFLSSLVVVFGFASAEAKFEVHDFFSDKVMYDPVSKKNVSVYDEVAAAWVNQQSKANYSDNAWKTYWKHVFYAKYAFKALKESKAWRDSLLAQTKRENFKSTAINGHGLESYSKADQLALIKKLWFYFDFEKSRGQSYAFFKDPNMGAVNTWVTNGMAGQYSTYTLSKSDAQFLNSKDALITAFGREEKAKPMHNTYYFLSNYYESGVDYAQTHAKTGAQWTPSAKNMVRLIYNGQKLYANNVEALYQAQKAKHLNMPNWMQVAQMGANNARNALQGKWQYAQHGAVPILYMTPLLDDKFDSSNLLARQLIYTGNKLLIEGNDWHDGIWGMKLSNGQYTGYNQLGMYLMKLRREMAMKLMGSRNNNNNNNTDPDWNYAGWLFAVPELRFVPIS